MKTDDLFTAPQVAKICSTDLKTIHNWVNRGEIKFFRTPGRHLRFRRQDILEFLSRFGYPIPDGFSPARHRAVIIDSLESTSSPIASALAPQMDVRSYTDHLDALLQIGKERPSLVLVHCGGNPEMARVVENISRSENDLPILVYGATTCTHEKNAGGTVEVVEASDATSVSAVVSGIVRSRLKSAS